MGLAAAIGCAGVARACPLCKAAGNLAKEDAPAPSTQPVNTQLADPNAEPVSTALDRPFRVGFSLDVANAYLHHGYVMQDRGLVIQPTLTLATQPIRSGSWTIEPYLLWFNSIHTEQSPGYAGGHGNHARVEKQYQRYLDQPHPGAPYPHYHTRLVDVYIFEEAGGGWVESTIRPGVVFSRGGLTIDAMLEMSFYPTDFHEPVYKLGAKVTYDLASLWDDSSPRDFSLNLIQTATFELSDENGGEESVFETGIEPVFRFGPPDRRVAVAFPVMFGWSPNGYYRDSNNDDYPMGFVSGGMEASMRLPIEEQLGRMYLNLGLTWVQMLADSTQFANGGDEGIFVARVGFGWTW